MCRAVRSIVQHLLGHVDMSGTDYTLAQTLEQAVETLPPSLSFLSTEAFTISESPVSEELCSHLPTNGSWIYWQLWPSMWQSTLPASREKKKKGSPRFVRTLTNTSFYWDDESTSFYSLVRSRLSAQLLKAATLLLLWTLSEPYPLLNNTNFTTRRAAQCLHMWPTHTRWSELVIRGEHSLPVLQMH